MMKKIHDIFLILLIKYSFFKLVTQQASDLAMILKLAVKNKERKRKRKLGVGDHSFR